MNMKMIYFAIMMLSSIASCDRDGSAEFMGYIKPNYQVSYEFNKPDRVLQLDQKLNEISGLCFDPVNNQLLTVNDEKGKLYALDISKGEITETYDIGKKGDYEGLALVDDTVYIVKSNGKITVYSIREQSVLSNIENDLKIKNDIEGMCADANGNILLACKARGLSKKDVIPNFIYQVASSNKKGVEEYLRLDVSASITQLEEVGISSQQFQNIIKHRFTRLYPSGIAINKQQNQLYILSAKNHVIAIVDIKNKNPLAYIALDPKVHAQPEGIAFDTNGSLYISNEAAGGKAVINIYESR